MDFLFHQRQRSRGHLQSRPAVAPKQVVERESNQPLVPADCGLRPIFFVVCRELSTCARGAEIAAVVASVAPGPESAAIVSVAAWHDHSSLAAFLGVGLFTYTTAANKVPLK
ncbi:MAG TPA: hypothetical protein VIY07_07850 [Pseudolabrys sp.]